MYVCVLSSAKQYRQFDCFHLHIKYRTCNDASAFNCGSQLYIACIFPFKESTVVRDFRWCLDKFYLDTPPRGLKNPNTVSICVNTGYSNSEFFYAVKYDLSKHIPLYAAYQVNSFEGNVARTNIWHVENDLSTKQRDTYYFQASNAYYAGSGYDKGHLFPALYNRDSIDKMISTFTLVNAAPMSLKLNRGAWKVVESRTLRLLESDCIFPGAKRFVITGTVPGKTRTKNAADGINIPEFVWNAIYCDSSHAEKKFMHLEWSISHLANQMGYIYPNDSIGELNRFLTRKVSGYQTVKLFDTR